MAGPKPCVTIIINNYNYGRFLKSAIESALQQTYQPLEVIVVDDGSLDHSLEIMDLYSARVRSILQPNRGQASAVNAGFVQSQGDIVIFLDSDDGLLPNAAEQVVAAFQAHPAAAKIMYFMEVMDEAGRPTGVCKPAAHLALQEGDLRQSELAFPFDLPWMPTSGNAFAAPVLRQIFPIPEAAFGKIGADWYLAHLSNLFGPVVWLREVLAYYRVHDANNFERAIHSLNLQQIRQTIVFAAQTRVYLHKYAAQLRLENQPGEILAVSDIANRLISLKLDPAGHPLPDDRRLTLFGKSLQAVRRRTDAGWRMKGLFILWFLGMLLAPTRLAHWLAEIFIYPERRTRANQWLGARQTQTGPRPQPEAAGTTRL